MSYPARGGCRPPPRRAGSFFLLSTGPFNGVECGNRDGLHRVSDRMQMSVGEVQINRCCFQIGMPQQELNLTKIFSRFQKVSRPAMSKAVRRYRFGDTSAFGSISNDEVDGFRAQGLVGTPVVIHPWEEIGFRLQPTPVL